MAKRDFTDVMKDALSKGVKNFGPQMGAELSRLGKQGSLELAQALFNGAAFTPYGPGQYTPSTPDLGKDGQAKAGNEALPQAEQQQERDGRDM